MKRATPERKKNRVRQSANIAIHTDEQPNKGRCKAKKFEAIQYSLGPNEEYIAVRSYEYDIWERNEDNLSIIYQDIFKKKDEGWKGLGECDPDYCFKEKGFYVLTKPCSVSEHQYGVSDLMNTAYWVFKLDTEH
ncbi:hypothetical protein Tco_1044820 [Tanacetum coccineum]|uniref:Uncharacterized protein n=1 Tax=Tanacetum coccineum TaxID=301880 RepID=A0ABQ5GR07_9ASTR